MADPAIPAGIMIQRVQIEFLQPPQFDIHCRIEVEGVNRHSVPWGATFQPSSRHAAIKLAAQLIEQARASF